MKAILRLYPLALLLLVWEIVARMGWVDPLFLPTFSSVLKSIVDNADELLKDSAISLSRAFIGLAIGSVAGILAGMLMSRWRAVEQFLDPLMAVIFPTPKLALFPLFMVWLGLGEASKIALVATTTFFPLAINTFAGMKGVDRFLVWNARSKGANAFQVLLRVMLPASVPFIFAGFRMATSLAFLLVVAAEMLSANNGLGNRILYAQRTFENETMYAAILIIATLGFVLDRVIGFIGRRLLAWQDTPHT
jgi:ABC-type nitrate/sulfonate/bicarbonate transport system permease component